MSTTRNDPRTPRDSQQQLALSIARAVQHGLPSPDSEEAIELSVQEALLREANGSELLLAYIRVAALTVLVLLASVARLSPTLVGLDRFSAWPPLVAVVCLLAAVGFLLAVKHDWRRPELRRAVPAADALLIAGGALIYLESVVAPGAPAVPGFFGIVATACAFLAFSGAFRLSRRAATRATTLAILAWVVVALWARLSVVPAVFIGATILATGLLGTRFTRMVRRVITTEVSRMRLAHLLAGAHEAIDAREEVLKVVAHDLRNPLGTIAMAADFLLDVPLAEDLRARQLGIIKRAGVRMNRLIHDLLDAARIEAGRLPIEPRSVEIGELVDAVLEMMEPLAADKELQLTAAVPAGLPAVQVDPERIVQVFSNLIGNAIKFTPQGGQITIRAEPQGARVRMVVADTGPGIPEEQLPKIFGRMWQARDTDTRGIGLGLTIAKAIIEAHGEEIGVESRVGEGTEFWFTLPTAPEAGAI